MSPCFPLKFNISAIKITSNALATSDWITLKKLQLYIVYPELYTIGNSFINYVTVALDDM